MSIATHSVEPEQVMAFLDGELSGADAQDVSNHVDHCAQCAHLAEQLRTASRSLSGWKVRAIPTRLEESVKDLIAKGVSGRRTGRVGFFIRTSFWTWKQWAAVSGGVMAAVCLLLAISLRAVHRSPELAMRDTADYYQPPMEQAHSSIDKLPPLPSKQSKAFNGQRATQSPAVTAYSDDEASSSPLIARSVSLSMVVKDFAACRSSLDIILERHHGYSEQLSVSTPENAPRSLQASLRIPAQQLSSVMGELKVLGRVENESQSGEEVTKQHTDLVARLKTSRDTEQRFRAILQQRTGKVAEVLQVEEEIARVRGDIERMEAEQKALEHRVDFATIELQITDEYKAQLNPPAAAIATRMHNAFVAGYRNASETVFGIVLFFAEYGPILLIWIAILILPIVLLWRRYRRTLEVI